MKSKTAREWKAWVTMGFIAGMAIVSIIWAICYQTLYKVESQNPPSIETVIWEEYPPRAVFIGGEWISAPLITWREDTEDSDYIIVFVNDLQGDAYGNGDNIDVYQVHKTQFQLRAHTVVQGVPGL